MLRWRLTLGVLIVATFVALAWLDYHAALPGVALLPVALVLSLLGAGELLAMFRRHSSDQQPIGWVVYGGVAIAVLAAGMPVFWQSTPGAGTVGQLGWLAIGLAAGLLVAIVGELWRFESPGQATVKLSLSLFAILYVGGLMGFLVQLRLLPGPGDDGRLGMLALASLVLIVKLSDVGQYTAGRLFGRHKLAPTISPGKTWEGVLGGLLFAVLGGLIALGLGRQMNLGPAATDTSAGVNWLVWLLVYPVSVAVAGIVGDLAESLLKRDAGVKDSSTWLPGFGGVLDVLDSLLVAAPVAYVFWSLALMDP